MEDFTPIDKVSLRFGSSPNSDPLTFKPGPLTVFVGPNNSGKSLILRELEANTRGRIIESVVMALPNLIEIRELLSPLITEQQDDRLTIAWRDVLEGTGSSSSFDRSAEPQLLGSLYHQFCSLSLRLDGATRLEMLKQTPLSNARSAPGGILGELFQDDTARQRIREALAEVFNFQFVIDITDLVHIRVKFSREPLPMADIEKRVTEEATYYMQRASDLSEFGDGILAFAGVVAAVLSSRYMRILIDEPEAFLHPPLVRRLGKTLTELAHSQRGNVFAATHSADFMMGCIQAGREVSVVRLTFRDGVGTSRLLASNELRTLMLDPLLRSTGVLSALFNEGAIVCEADRDRVFYHEINERLLDSGRPGATDCVFLNAQNWQTTGRVIYPLRKMGIPAAAIVDLDVLWVPRDFAELLRAAFVPEPTRRALGELRSELCTQLELVFKQEQGLASIGPPEHERFKKWIKRGGIEHLSGTSRDSASGLLSSIANYGVFVVPCGEVEAWLPNLGVKSGKKEWLRSIFDKLGEHADAPCLVNPKSADVWSFIESVATWIGDGDRQGIPD